jgi:hypothetical protein
MGLKTILAQKKKPIVNQWVDRVVATYPADTAKFLNAQKDPFANPVGHQTRQSLADAFDELITGADPDTLALRMDPLIRVRAVQTMFSPSQAVGFVFLLKPIIKESLKDRLDNPVLAQELIEFESALDDLALLAFDIYVQCREKIYALKANIEKDKIYKAFVRAGLVCEVSPEEPELKVLR